jgi:large subunit ribosomal protein L19
VFPVNSPNIEKVEIESESEVMRARMYYLRNRTGKAAMAVKKKRYDAEEVAAVSATAAPAAPAAEAPTAS